MDRLTSEQAAEIAAQRAENTATRRSASPALEEILFQPLPVLDHGFIRVIDYMGNDDAVVQAARVSYGRGTRRVSEDANLINYLMRHAHSTPFEMAEIKLHVKLPIFVARQWIRHRTANVNEYSARYSILDKEFYLPEAANLAAQSSANRQGRGDVLEGAEAAETLDLLSRESERSYASYKKLLNSDDDDQPIDPERQGLARELARMTLPVNFYTQWYWKIDLHNFMGFLRLRADSHAQYEIRAYANVLLGVLERWVPLTYKSFIEHKLASVQLSASAIKVVRKIIANESVDQATSGLSKREWSELTDLLEIKS